MSQMKWKQNVEVKKRWYLFKRCHVEIISPSSKKKYSISFQTFVWEIFSPISPIGHWWLPQSCWWDCSVSTSAPTLGKKTWEIYLNVLLYSPASENPQTKLTPSLYQLTCPERLNSVFLNSSPDYESTGFLLWKFDGTIGEFIFFSTPQKRKTHGKKWPHLSELLLIT